MRNQEESNTWIAIKATHPSEDFDEKVYE